jgi:Rrf2 family transcriptional regulator, cysteine metabolism repressor
MRLSTRSRYGLRALIELAANHGNGNINMRAIAEQQGLSQKYLDSLFNSLKLAGLVVSQRGPGGGWSLTRSPDRIRLTEVFTALEGSLGLVQCVDFPDSCSRRDSCATSEVYERIHEAIVGVLDGITLEQLQQRKIELEHLLPETPGADLCARPD